MNVFRKYQWSGIVLFSFFTVAAAVDLKNSDGSLKKTVWAHYTPWYNPLNTDFTVSHDYSYPVFRSSGDQIEDYRREFELAKQQGIDGFLVDLVCYDGKETVFVKEMVLMLKAAEGMDFWIAPCLDRIPSPEWQTSQLLKIFKECADHPNYPTIGDKYVVATYSWYGRSPEGWEEIRTAMAGRGYPLYLIANMEKGYQKITPELFSRYRETYEMAYAFSHLSLSGDDELVVLRHIRDYAKENGAAWMATVWPGYLGAWLNGRNAYYQPYLGFDQVLYCFDAVHELNPDWVHLTTWNDYDETPYMPTAFEFGGNMLINRYLLDRWRGAPLPSETQILFAYHREELIGTVLRIEGLVLPGETKNPVTISGRLLGDADEGVYELPSKIFKTIGENLYVRGEWNVPTAELGAAPAVVPEITVTENGMSRTSRLPAVMLKTGWIQNQTTVKVPFDRMVDDSAELVIHQDDHLLTAGIQFQCSENVVRAELFRNDRPLGPLTCTVTDHPLLFAQLSFLPGRTDVVLSGGRFFSAARNNTERGEPTFSWTTNSIISREAGNWQLINLQAEVDVKGSIAIKLNDSPAKEVGVSELLKSHVISLDGKTHLVMTDFDSEVNSHPLLPPARDGRLALKVWSREKLENDVFYVRFETESGKLFFSSILTPFCEQKEPVELTVLQTMCNLETSSKSAGKPGRTGFLGNPPYITPQATNAMVHPASLRAGRWTFEQSSWDSLGERPIRTAKKNIWVDGADYISDGGHDGGKCLRLDERSGVEMRARVWPMGACTIEFFVKPEEKAEVKWNLIQRKGYAGSFSFYLLPNGCLKAERDGDGLQGGSLTSADSLPVGEWTCVRLVYDGKRAELFLNGKQSAQASIPLERSYGNSTAVIGGEGQFKGLFDDLTILSYPVFPPESEESVGR